MRALLAVIALFTPHHHWHRSTASWYYDAGSTASGRHYTYGFASLKFGNRWGKRIRFCYHRRCVTGRLDDHGPYVSGRSFDLNQTLAGALHFSGVDTVKWRAL